MKNEDALMSATCSHALVLMSWLYHVIHIQCLTCAMSVNHDKLKSAGRPENFIRWVLV